MPKAPVGYTGGGFAVARNLHGRYSIGGAISLAQPCSVSDRAGGRKEVTPYGKIPAECTRWNTGGSGGSDCRLDFLSLTACPGMDDSHIGA